MSRGGRCLGAACDCAQHIVNCYKILKLAISRNTRFLDPWGSSPLLKSMDTLHSLSASVNKNGQ